MLTTGFNFEKIGLICILLIEQELTHLAYNAEEKAYQNLKQLIGRGNRKTQKTQILIQTCIPNHASIKRLTEESYKDFLQSTLKERKLFSYPPFFEFATLDYRNEEEKKSLAYIQKLEQFL